MNTSQWKLVPLLLTLATSFALYGCEKKTAVDKESDSAEFFKEIDNMAMQENTEILNEQLENAEMNQALPDAADVAPGPGAPVQTTAFAPEKPTIQDIQQALKNANLYQGKLDGVLGPRSKKSIEAFQSQNGLKVDGKVGPMTWQKLKVYYNPSASAAPAPTETSVAEENPDGPVEEIRD